MKLSIFIALIVTTVHMGDCRPQFDFSWINDMVGDIQRNVQHSVQETQRRVSKMIKEQMDQADKLIEEYESQNSTGDGDSLINLNGVSISVNVEDDRRVAVISGRNRDGKRYTRRIVDRVEDGVQYRTVTNFYPDTDSVNKRTYTRDLSDPDATFVPDDE